MTKHSTKVAVLAALERVVGGNVKRLKGRYRIGLAAVCLEAGITRNALYQGHPGLVDEIRARLAPLKQSPPRKRGDLEKLRDENRELSRRVASLLSQNAQLLYRSSVAEKRLEEMSRLQETDRKRLMA